MARYYELYKSLILAITFSGIYFTSIEKIYGQKVYIKLLKYLYILPAICSPIHLGASIWYTLFDAHDEKSRIFGVTVSLFSYFVFFTFYSFYLSRHQFERLFELWDSLFQEELFPEHRQELLTKNRNVTIRWLKGFGGIVLFACFGYCILMYFNPAKKVHHPTGFKYRHQSPDFELVHTLDFIVTTFGCVGLIAFDSMTMAFISMEEAQLQHLKVSLAWIVDTVYVTDSGSIRIKSVETNDAHPDKDQMTKAFEETRKQIQIWITHHQQVLRFHNEFQKVYSIPLSMKLLYFVFIICFTFFLMLADELNPIDIAFCLQYFFDNYTIFYLNVMYADKVAETSNTIFGDAFGKSWHLYPKEMKTLFHIIQLQSKRPLRYLAFKIYSLNSSSFLKMLSSAYSLFTFVIQVNRKKIKLLNSETSVRP